MKKLFLKIFLIISVSYAPVSFGVEKTIITINQFVSHVALDAAYKGFMEGLEKRGIKGDAAITYANAQGNISNSVQISKHQSSLNPKYMVSIATPSTQTNLKAKEKNSVLAFLAVTDPESIGLSERSDVIGVTDTPPIAELITKTLEIFPDVKNMGVIFNAGEINSVKTVQDLEKILKNQKIFLKKITVTSSNDLKNAINKLIENVDIIYLPQDNTVISGLESIISISNTHDIPLIANDPTLVDKGVFMALGSNYFQSGMQLAYMIADLIEGKVLKSMIQKPAVKELKINSDLAEKMKVNIPKNIEAEVIK